MDHTNTKNLNSMISFNLFCCFFVLIALLLLCYSGYRAHVLSFTYDESNSYLNIIKALDGNINKMASSNTHLLTSLHMLVAIKLGWTSEFTLRIPSLIGHLLFVSATGVVFFKFTHKIIGLCGFILANMNPFLIDFFSLARGYGLSIGLAMAGLSILQVARDPVDSSIFARYRDEVAFALISMSVFANFMTAYLFILVFVVLICRSLFKNSTIFEVLHNYQHNIKNSFRENRFHFGIFSISFLLLFPVYIVLYFKKELYFGGRSGFFHDTITSLGLSYLYGNTNSKIIFYVICAALFSIGGFAFWESIRRQRITTFTNVFVLVLFVMIFMSNFMFYVHGTPLPVERTAIIIWPILVVGLFLYFDKIPNFRWHISVLSLLLTMGCLFNFYVAANFTHVLSWKYDSAIKSFIAEIGFVSLNHDLDVIGVNWIHVPAATFYIRRFENLSNVKLVATEDNWCAGLWRDELNSSYFGEIKCKDGAENFFSHVDRKIALIVDDLSKRRILTNSRNINMYLYDSVSKTGLYFIL